MKKKSRSNSLNQIPLSQQPSPQKSQANKGQAPIQQEKFSLYLLIEVQRTATQQEIKKQYRKLALKYHPDKNKEDPDAKQKFHKFKQAYDILADPEKRKIYDQTGLVGNGEQFDEKSFQSAYDYFRNMFKKVTKQDIEEFQKTYRFGPMEEQDLLQYYEDHKGNMAQLIESIPLSSNDDVTRFIQFFEDKIKNGSLEKYKSFDKTKNKVKLLKDETQDFEEHEKEKKNQEFKDLALAIRQKRSNEQADFLAALEAKYGGGKKKKGGPKVQEEAGKKKRKAAKQE